MGWERCKKTALPAYPGVTHVPRTPPNLPFLFLRPPSRIKPAMPPFVRGRRPWHRPRTRCLTQRWRNDDALTHNALTGRRLPCRRWPLSPSRFRCPPPSRPPPGLLCYHDELRHLERRPLHRGLGLGQDGLLLEGLLPRQLVVLLPQRLVQRGTPGMRRSMRST